MPTQPLLKGDILTNSTANHSALPSNGSRSQLRSLSELDLSRTRSPSHLEVNGAGVNGTLPGGLPRAASCDDRLIVMEEFAPLQTTLHSEKSEENEMGWQLSLINFTSKRRGSQKEDKKLSNSIRRYYKRQDELISAYEGLHQMEAGSDNMESAKKLRRQAAILAKLSFFCNFLLLCGKLVAAVLSGSLSVITSVIDSSVDLASGVLMWWSGRAMKRPDRYQYPQGRTKLEPVAIVVLSVVMSLASIQMIRQSVEKIILFANYDLENPEHHNKTAVFCLTVNEMRDYVSPDGDHGPVFDIESIVICVLTICIKLGLFIVCRRVAIPGSQALAHDHRNDVISNTAAIACGLIGYKVWKYADPIGAILISIYIVISWCVMGWEQIEMLTGHTARPDFLKKLTFIAINHHEKVTHVDTVRAFHFGNNFLVEVDIVLPGEMKLMEAHDIGEALQCRLESLDEVERAFVHLDYEVNHHPNSEHKVV